jgi:hypothetical protein
MNDTTTPAASGRAVPYPPGQVGPWADSLFCSLALAALARFVGRADTEAAHLAAARHAAGLIIGRGCAA